MSALRNVAVILAGGTGTRVGLSIPKQLIKVAGKPIIEHTIGAFEDAPGIDEVIVLMAPGHLDDVRAIVAKGQYQKVSAILEGGTTRNETTAAALAVLGDDECNVLFHDAVRPLVSQTIIASCVAALRDYEAVDTAIPSADTVISVDESATHIRDVLPRHLLRRGQTPQAFRLSVIRRAYERAWEDPDFTATDDCSVVLRYLPQVPITVVPGHDRNMKVTEPIDVSIADKLFQMESADEPLGLDDDQYAEAMQGKTMVVFGGSYGIGGDVARLAARYGARVHSFSRSTTGTHVDRREDLARAASRVLEIDGKVDFVVNTAGVLPMGELAETSEEAVWSATEINYLAPIFIAQEFYEHLAATQGSLLLYTSSSYTRGRRGYALYSSAKAATVNLTQALADEWAGQVRVNCVNPERTATPMRTQAFGEEPEGTLLQSHVVAQRSLDVLLSNQTGHVFDVRRGDPASKSEGVRSDVLH